MQLLFFGQITRVLLGLLVYSLFTGNRGRNKKCASIYFEIKIGCFLCFGKIVVLLKLSFLVGFCLLSPKNSLVETNHVLAESALGKDVPTTFSSQFLLQPQTKLILKNM